MAHLFTIASLFRKNYLKYSLLVALVALGAIAASRFTSAKNEQNKSIVATFLPMYLFTKAVVGSETQVDILIPPGSEVHEYQATPQNARTLAEADVLVQNGLELEAFLENLISNAGNSQLKEIDASQGIETLEI